MHLPQLWCEVQDTGMWPSPEARRNCKIERLSRREHIAWHYNCLVIPRDILLCPRTQLSPMTARMCP